MELMLETEAVVVKAEAHHLRDDGQQDHIQRKRNTVTVIAAVSQVAQIHRPSGNEERAEYSQPKYSIEDGEAPANAVVVSRVGGVDFLC
jgi:hypothetical protein